MVIINRHSHDGFTLTKYVKTKRGQEVDVSKRYIGYSIKDAKKLFNQLCKNVKQSNEYVPYVIYL